MYKLNPLTNGGYYKGIVSFISYCHAVDTINVKLQDNHLDYLHEFTLSFCSLKEF